MNIVTPFFQQCTRTPNHLAFFEAENQLSYSELKDIILRIATYFQSHNVQNQCIAIALDRGIHAACCIYGILAAGAIYLPLDIKNPATRLKVIIEDAQPRFVIGFGPSPEWLIEPDKWLDYSQIPTTHSHLAPLEKTPTSLAAILYTSGSTGKPNGVALSHQALSNFSSWAQKTFSINQEERIASLTPFHFDLSIFDLFTSLSSGASVFFMPTHLTLTPSRLTDWLDEHQISCWYTVPSILSFIGLKGSLEKKSLPHLNQIIFAGEVFPTVHLIKLTNILPDVTFYNLYGPTETNVSCYWKIERDRLNPEHNIPIGHSACQAKLTINSETGELIVNSINNFSGYWIQGKLEPIASNNYATGDKVSLNQYGEYCYHGRLDRMLKCSGFRVEPAEIEHYISQLDGIQNCAVIGIKDITSGQRPVAVVVLERDIDLAEVIKPLRKQLPIYMQPCKFTVLDKLPALSNGKIDYQAIQALFNS